MGKKIRRPGWLASVTIGRRFFGVSSSAIVPFFAYLMVVQVWLGRASSEWIRLPGQWLVFMLLTAFGIPLVISAVTGLMVATMARRQRLEVRGFLFSGATLIPDVRVSPSRPGGIAEGRASNAARSLLLVVVAVAGVAVAYAQFGTEGSGAFRAYWVGAVSAGWSVLALPSALLDLLAGFLWTAPTSQVRRRRFRMVSLALAALILLWGIASLSWPQDSPLSALLRFTLGLPVFVGLALALMTSLSVTILQRAIPRDLRHAAVEAIALAGSLRASDALKASGTPGFLVTDEEGHLRGWLSRDDAVGSPDSRLIDLARPLVDTVPIGAEQYPSDLLNVLDPHLDGSEVVALAADGTPVGYIVVARAFEHVTGDSAWSRSLEST